MIIFAACSPKSDTNNTHESSESNNPNVYSTQIGKMKVHLLSERQQKENIKILIGATPEIIQECAPDSTFPNAINARKALLEYVVENDIPIAEMHIAYTGIGKIQKTDKGYKFLPL